MRWTIGGAQAANFCFKSLCRALAWRHGEDAAETWFWSMTPLPAGYPRLGQYLDGLIMLVLPYRLSLRYTDRRLAEIDAYIDRELKKLREREDERGNAGQVSEVSG